MKERWMWLSLWPWAAQAILEGAKGLDVRRMCPRAPMPIKALLYAAGQGIMGTAIITDTFPLDLDQLNIVMGMTHGLVDGLAQDAGLTKERLEKHLEGARRPTALRLIDAQAWPRTVSLNEVRAAIGPITVPRSWRYLDGPTARRLKHIAMRGWT